MTSVEFQKKSHVEGDHARRPGPGDRSAAPFSILFDTPSFPGDRLQREPPECFVDLNLDQIVDAATAEWATYDIKPFFYTPLHRVDAVRYRQEIFQDLEDAALCERVRSFAQAMNSVREHLTQSDKLYCTYHKQAWFLCAVEIYCEAAQRFVSDLSSLELKSRGLLAFRKYFSNYIGSRYFTSLVQETGTLRADLSKVRYSILIKDNGFTVDLYHSETDYSAQIEETFEKFKQGAVKDYRVSYRLTLDMNHIEAKILEFVAVLNPELFARLDHYRVEHADFIEPVIAGFDHEIHFYVAYLAHITRLRRTAGLRFCYPRVTARSKEVYDYDGFDLALAHKLSEEQRPIVRNDFHLKGHERILVVSGPNQGGKTTFARTFGQLHYLASIGCPVPGGDAQLFLWDRLFTHFERREKVENLRGKLEDDLVRVHSMFQRATSRSIIIMNEIFSSTTLQDEIFLSRSVMEKMLKLDLLGVWVTFVDELSSLGEQTVSMVSTIVPENPALRTFKIVRRPADGLAYATAIVEKYRLTYEQVKERIEQKP